MSADSISQNCQTAVKNVLISQYRASLMMLEKSIHTCSDELWDLEQYSNRTWQLVYHLLYFTDLYLYQNLKGRKHWPLHRKDHQNLGEWQGKTPYSKSEMLEFLRYLVNRLEPAVQELDLSHPESGFHWYKVNKLEHQLVNLKHLQHHLAQFLDRIRNHQGAGVSWIRDGSGDTRKTG